MKPPLLRLATAFAFASQLTVGQSPGDVTVFGRTDGNVETIVCYDGTLSVTRTLQLTGPGGVSADTPIAMSSTGERWLVHDPLNTTQVLHFGPGEQPVASTGLAANPVNITASSVGASFVLTRIPLLAPAPMSRIDADGSIAWSSMEAPSFFEWYPTEIVWTANGELWMGDETRDLPDVLKTVPFIHRVDPDTGAVLRTLELPSLGAPEFDSFLTRLVGAPDGTMWAFMFGGLTGFQFHQTDGVSMLTSFPSASSTNGFAVQVRVDARGRLYLTNNRDPPLGPFGDIILCYDPSDPAVPVEYQTGGMIRGFCFGPTGEDLFIATQDLETIVDRRLERLNLISGVRSSIPLSPAMTNAQIAWGSDISGFHYANVIDRAGDFDSDGASNGAETLAGSNPFDATSRPEGAKVYLSFLASNAIVLTFFDPDGVLDLTDGLDASSVSLVAEGYGEILPFLVNFLTSVTVTPDGLTARAEFGGLPLPNSLKLPLTLRAADFTGAGSSDWQVSPPGLLDGP